MDKLKPCPFCGQVPNLEKKPLWRTYGGTTRGHHGCFEFVVKCENPNCLCNIALSDNTTIYLPTDEARQNAIEAWNRRADNGN